MHFWWSAILFLHGCYFAASYPCAEVESFLTNVLYSTLTGSCSGVNQMDPLFIDCIEGNFATLQYVDVNNTVTGLSKTRISFLKVSEDNNMTMFKLDIPSFTIKATHNVSGYVLYLPITATNSYGEIDYGRYSMKVYAQLAQVTGCNNFTFWQFGNFSVDPRAITPVNFILSPAYDNNGTDVSLQRNLFMDQNWQDVAYFVQDTKAEPIIQKLLTYANNYLLTVPISTIFNPLVCTCSPNCPCSTCLLPM